MFINVHVVPVFPFFPLKARFTLQAASTDTFSMLTHIRGFLGFGFLPTVTSAYRSRSWGLTHQSSENYATHSKSWAPMNRISVHGGRYPVRNLPPVRSARVHPRDVTNPIEIVRLLKTCTWLNVYDVTIKSFRKNLV